MLDQTALNIPIDLTVDTRGVPNGKVVHPTSQVPVQLSNQYPDWFEALMTVRHFVQLLPFLLDGLRQGKHIQVLLIASAACWLSLTRRASQAPRLIFPRALPPTTPEGPASACLLLPH